MDFMDARTADAALSRIRHATEWSTIAVDVDDATVLGMSRSMDGIDVYLYDVVSDDVLVEGTAQTLGNALRIASFMLQGITKSEWPNQ